MRSGATRLSDFRGQRPRTGGRNCDRPGCGGPGEYRAPRSRGDHSEEPYWFCLDHVREYNAAWDYFRGMGPEEIERARRADIIGGRPTWPMGLRSTETAFAGRAYRLRREDLEEALRRFFRVTEDDPAPPPRRRPMTPEEEALAVLDLPADATPADIKLRWKELVKRNHPDANGGDKAAEERIKLINRAYTVLKSAGARKAAAD